LWLEKNYDGYKAYSVSKYNENEQKGVWKETLKLLKKLGYEIESL
jgi:hypothetical protein